MVSQFDLEQAIMAAWATADDLNLMTDHMLDRADEYDVDATANTLLGVQQLHHMRMQKVWEIFETLVEERWFGAYGDADEELDADDADDAVNQPTRAQDCKWPRD